MQCKLLKVNTLWPNDAIMHLKIWSLLIQAMACRLSDAKPLHEPLKHQYFTYCQVDLYEQSPVKSESRS